MLTVLVVGLVSLAPVALVALMAGGPELWEIGEDRDQAIRAQAREGRS